MTMDELRGAVMSLDTLAAYQNEAVVSRTLLKSDGVSVTLFAFDQGQELSEHTVPHDALVQVLDGEVEIRIDGTPHHLQAGDVVIMPGGRSHAVKATRRFKMLLTLPRA